MKFFSASDFNNLRLLCLGDVMLDRFINGHVERISPEGPIPILRYTQESLMLGGAGNVVRNMVALGGQCHFLTHIGDDEVGRIVEQKLMEEERITFRLLKSHGVTTQKTRFIANSHHLLRLDHENPIPLTTFQEDEVKKWIDDIFGCKNSVDHKKYDAIVLSDYKKGFCTPAICQYIILKASQLGLPVIVDPKGSDCDKYAGATWITPNLQELEKLAHRPLSDIEDIVSAAQMMRSRYFISHIVVTLGNRGMVYVGPSVEEVRDEAGIVLPYATHYINTKAQEVFDVSGAGDTVVACLSLGVAQHHQKTQTQKDLSLESSYAVDLCLLANQAASIAVSKVGTATVSGKELETSYYMEALAPISVAMPKKKITSFEQIVPLVHRWRRQGLRVGFTNGCFDLLHQGHLKLLSEAKLACDRLIIGLNTDRSVQQNKGPHRPIYCEQARAQILSHLSIVDAIVLFDELTPLNLINLILPDVLIKGADYDLKEIVGADVVLKRGGQILRVTLDEESSTTATIAKTRKGCAL